MFRPVSETDEPALGEIRLQRAASWRRLLAWTIDGVGLALFTGLLFRAGAAITGLSPGRASPESGIDWIVDVATRHGAVLVLLAAFLSLSAFVYATLSHALMGATLGKRAVGLRVVTRLGVRPSLARSAVRSLLAVVSLGLLGLGALAAFFTRSHRSLHDLLSGTYVVEPP
jgi:uncharacterized RDD family membrane protein YckC